MNMDIEVKSLCHLTHWHIHTHTYGNFGKCKWMWEKLKVKMCKAKKKIKIEIFKTLWLFHRKFLISSCIIQLSTRVISLEMLGIIHHVWTRKRNEMKWKCLPKELFFLLLLIVAKSTVNEWQCNLQKKLLKLIFFANILMLMRQF